MSSPFLVVVTQNFPPDIGGIQSLMGCLADEFASRGKRVVVFADRRTETPKNIGHSRYEVHRFGGPRPFRIMRKRFALKAFLKEQSIEGIITDSWKSVEALPQTDIPLLVLAHGTEIPPAASWQKIRRIRKALSRATTIAANSKFTAELIRPYLSPSTRLHVVNPAVTPLIEPSPENREAAARLLATNLSSETTAHRLVTIARLEPRKGIDMVIRALPSLVSEFPGLRYVVAGKGDDLQRLVSLAEAEGVASHVTFLGAVSEGLRAALLESADLFVMPARREAASVEGFGIVYLEAAWFGIASIAGREGGAPDAVLDCKTGLLCDPYDPASVGDSIRRLLIDTKLRGELGKTAADRVRMEFSWSKVADRYFVALRERD
jgi:phosphatidylinositol alpha-1,6-mannosyltransferase